MAGHTPTPWVAVRHEQDERFWDVRDVATNCSIIDTDNSGCASDPSQDDVFFTEANAAFIIRACNAHDSLVECLQAVVDELGEFLQPANLEMAACVLKKARG